MRKMEEEMSRFRSQLIASRQDRHVSSSSVTSTHTSTSSSTCSRSSKQQAFSKQQQQVESPANWLTELDSPLIRDSEGGKTLKLRFDVTDYEPEQIVVKTVDNRLQVHAKREETSDTMRMYREYNREFLLPECTDPNLITSSLSADGVLTVEAPLISSGRDNLLEDKKL